MRFGGALDSATGGGPHDRIQLLPLNPTFELITLEPEEAGDLMIAGDVSATSSSSSITWDKLRLLRA
jgi:hypothetical protein